MTDFVIQQTWVNIEYVNLMMKLISICDKSIIGKLEYVSWVEVILEGQGSNFMTSKAESCLALLITNTTA